MEVSSLSFSISSFEMMTAQHYISIVLLTGLVPTVVLLGLNLLVDPYNELGIRLVPQPLVETSRTEKISLLQQARKRPELMIFGRSRTMELNPKRFPVSAFNMAVNSGFLKIYWRRYFGSKNTIICPAKHC